MAPEPQRAAQPHHLNPHIIPVERALLARAAALETGTGYGQSEMADGTVTWDARVPGEPEPAAKWLAAQFRELAAELHHW